MKALEYSHRALRMASFLKHINVEVLFINKYCLFVGVSSTIMAQTFSAIVTTSCLLHLSHKFIYVFLRFYYYSLIRWKFLFFSLSFSFTPYIFSSREQCLLAPLVFFTACPQWQADSLADSTMTLYCLLSSLFRNRLLFPLYVCIWEGNSLIYHVFAILQATHVSIFLLPFVSVTHLCFIND